MKQIFYIIVLSLLLVSAVSGIAILVYPDVAAGYGEVEPSEIEPEQEPEQKPEQEPSAPAEAPVPVPQPERDPPRAADAGRPKIYLILDDGGHSLDHLRWFSEFPGVFTVAVLPHLTYSREVARMTVALGHELMLHQPMEAQGGNDPGPGAIYTAQPDHHIRRIVRRNLAQFPDVVGVNNHMGSKATEDARVMDVVISTLDIRDLFFLDSRTSAASVVDAINSDRGRPILRRDVFLDNVRTDEAISQQLDEALQIADHRGSVVMIGHVTSPELARVLLSRYDEITAAGYEFYPVSDLVAGEEAQLVHADTGN